MTEIDYHNQTTIVTGASSGLGAEFARQLAARGSNLVLVARRADRLEALAEELTRAHGVTVTVVARDLGQPDAGRTLRAELESRGIHATGLVNNAGFGTHNAFTDEDPDRLQDMIALNVGALVDLSRAYFEPLTSAEHRCADQRREPAGLPAHPLPEPSTARPRPSCSASPKSCGRRPVAPACASSRSPRARWRPSSSTPPAASRPTTASSGNP